MMITPEQLRAARALLRLEQTELAERAHVSVVTIRRLEGGRQGDRVTPSTLAGVREALEQAGAEFIPDGVRRRRTSRTRRPPSLTICAPSACGAQRDCRAASC